MYGPKKMFLNERERERAVPPSIQPLPLSPSSSVITLEFQTAAPDLLLLYTQGLAKVHADYMALELRGGRLFYSYNLGSGRVYIQTMGTYDDGYVHMVSSTIM